MQETLNTETLEEMITMQQEQERKEFYGKNLGLTFQIADDTLDYNSDLKFFGKKIGKDFLEGKITLPVILLFQNVSSIEKDKLKNIFKQETRSNDDLNLTLELIKKYNIINECYKKAEHFINLASNSLTVFKDSDEKKILESLTSFSLQRTFQGLNKDLTQFPSVSLVYLSLS